LQLNLARYPAPIRIIIFLLLLLLIWLPLAVPIYLWVKDSDWVSILTMAGLYVEFIVLLRLWGKQVYADPNLLQRYGLILTRQNGLELLWGLGIGVTSLLALFAIEGGLGWLFWAIPSQTLPWLIVEGLLVALGVGFAEELLFRGWLLDELQRDYSLSLALGANSALFAIAHFIRPLEAVRETWPQFAGLVMLGLVLVWAKRATGYGEELGRLGLPVGLHGGLVWGYYLVNVGGWVTYSSQVPEWVTGIDGNPLAGAMGLGCLGAIAIAMQHAAQRAKIRSK